ncbi:MAG: hypothetical protein ACRBCJ_12860 [Hyphomicrobiaceae bacterium]
MLQEVAGKSDAPDVSKLQQIPLIETGSDFPLTTLMAEEQRAHALLDLATHRAPASALKVLDSISRRWLVKWNNRHLDEIDAIAKRLARPGAYFLSVNYEWACTCRVAPSPDGKSARLVRVLDWKTPGLGENICAARVKGGAGEFLTMTWPGYTGVLQVMAPGRFSIALNQAPMPAPIGVFLMDWAANRRRVWRMPHQTAAHLLRQVCEEAVSYADAKEMLMTEKIAAPAIYSLAGMTAQETCVIERMEEKSSVRNGVAIAANHWQDGRWTGHHRGVDSPGREQQMCHVGTEFDTDFKWLKSPVLNPRTRLAMVADASEGRVIAKGFENGRGATKTLDLVM